MMLSHGECIHTSGIEQRDRHVAASIQFQAGDKCQVKLPEGQLYRGEVTRLDVTPGCHMVCVRVCVWVGVCVCVHVGVSVNTALVHKDERVRVNVTFCLFHCRFMYTSAMKSKYCLSSQSSLSYLVAM